MARRDVQLVQRAVPVAVGEVFGVEPGQCFRQIGGPVEVAPPLLEAFCRRGRGVAERRGLQRAEIGEVVGRRADRNVGLGGDPSMGQRTEALAGDDSARRLDDRLTPAGGIAGTAFRTGRLRGRFQWAPPSWSVTTPATISPTPATLAADNGEPRNSTAIRTIAAVPMADHRA